MIDRHILVVFLRIGKWLLEALFLNMGLVILVLELERRELALIAIIFGCLSTFTAFSSFATLSAFC